MESGLRQSKYNANEDMTSEMTSVTTEESSSSSTNDNDKDKPSIFHKLLTIRQNFQQASAEGFGTKARNVANTMSIGDIVVPLCGNLAQRQILANRGIYAGVEYEITSLTSANGKDLSTMEGLDPNIRTKVTAQIKPAYKLRDHLERTDWPVEVQPLQEVPLWLSKTTYEAGTMVGTLSLSLTYLSMAAILAFFVRFAYVPSPSMQPALNPGDVVLVTRSVPIGPFFQPNVGDVVLFDPPSELNRVVAASTAAMEHGAALPNKGDQFLKRVVAKGGECVGVKNSEPYVDLSLSAMPSSSSLLEPENTGSTRTRKFRVDIVGPYAQPSMFSETSWNRPPEKLKKNEWFVAGDNGFRSVDSRVWGPLNGRYIFGTAKFVLWPLQDFGPIQDGQILTIEK
jgi:signal peptidase I